MSPAVSSLLKHDFLITKVECYFQKWLLNSIRWLLPSNENYLLKITVIKDRSRMSATSQMELFVTTTKLFNILGDNSLLLKAVNFCYKNSILDTNRGLDPTVVKCSPITVNGCLPRKLLLNWIRFQPNEKRLAKNHCNQGESRTLTMI